MPQGLFSFLFLFAIMCVGLQYYRSRLNTKQTGTPLVKPKKYNRPTRLKGNHVWQGQHGTDTIAMEEQNNKQTPYVTHSWPSNGTEESMYH